MGNVLRSLMVKVGADLTDFDKSLKKMAKELKSAGKEITATGKTLTKSLTLPILAVGAGALSASIDFESAFAGVRKTVNATEEQFAMLEQGIREMSEQMPMAASDIARIAESAGQLGIKTESILTFTKTMADLGVATNLTGEEAASTFAQFANITQMPQENFDKLGSTVVALGNNLATTERDIADMALRLAGAGKQVKLSEAQILAFAGALSSVGIEAQAGGSAFSKVMVQMQLAAETGSEDLSRFAKVAGMSAEEFKEAYQEDAAGALIGFIKGLSESEKQGMSAIKVLDDMGITEVRMRDALLRAAGASDIFTGALELGSEAWEENTALTKEAEQRYGTTQSQLEILKNKAADVGITLGNALVPALVGVLDAVKPLLEQISKMAEGFANADEKTQKTILTIAGIAAGIGPALVIIGKLTTGLSEVVGHFASAIKIISGGGGFTAALGALIGPAGVVVLAIGVLAGLALAIKSVIDRNNELFAEVNKVKEANDNLNGSFEKADETFKSTADSINANAEEARLLTARLEELDGQTAKTKDDKEEYANIVQRLNELYPNLNAFIEEETGKINLSTDAILANVEAMQQKALTAAIQERMTQKTAAYADAVIELEKAEKKVTDTEEALRTKHIELDNIYALIAASMGLTNDEFNKLDANTRGQAMASSQYRERLNELKQEVNNLTITLPSLKKAKDELSVSVSNAKTEIQEETRAVREAINSLQDFGSAGANAGEALAQGMFSKVGAVRAAAQALADAAVVKVKNTLEIKSPSKVFERLGEMATKGFALGIDDLMDGTQGMVQMASPVTTPQYLQTGYSTANIVVNLDSKVLARAIGQPLTDTIRVKTGIR